MTKEWMLICSLKLMPAMFFWEWTTTIGTTRTTTISILTKKESVISFRMITTIFLEQTVLMATTLQQEIL